MKDAPDFSPTAIDVYLRPEWAAKEGTDKIFFKEGVNVGFGVKAEILYTVPAGKTLFVNVLSFSIRVTTDTDYDHFLYAQGYITTQEALGRVHEQGGVGGGSIVFSKPIVVSSTKFIRIGVNNFSNLTCFTSITALGYEV